MDYERIFLFNEIFIILRIIKSTFKVLIFSLVFKYNFAIIEDRAFKITSSSCHHQKLNR